MFSVDGLAIRAEGRVQLRASRESADGRDRPGRPRIRRVLLRRDRRSATAISCISASSRLRIKSASGTSRHGGTDAVCLGRRSPRRQLRRFNELKAERLQSRLIGNFEWSFYQRRFDGARVDVDRPHWHFNLAAFRAHARRLRRVDQPVDAEGAGRDQRRSRCKSSNVEWQGFRLLRIAIDGAKLRSSTTPFRSIARLTSRSRPWAARTRACRRRATGEFDLVAWVAAQSGDWYGRSHRAASVALEAGHRWTRTPARPWLRAGYLWASGDRNGDDDRHGTFFQMLPSSRKYALSSVYAQMNLSDAFAQLAIEPRGLRARIEVHALHLASGADLWYQGSGATSSKGRYFGYSGRAAGGDTALGTVLEGAVDVPIRKHWSINGYAGIDVRRRASSRTGSPTNVLRSGPSKTSFVSDERRE